MNNIPKDVLKAYEKHKKFMGKCWGHGEPVEHWKDDDGVLCIRYDSGYWWHYQDIDTDFIFW